MYYLNLLNWLSTTIEGKVVFDGEYFIIKQMFNNLEELKNNPKTKSGTPLYINFQHKEPFNYIEYYIFEDVINGREVTIKFISIKNTELLTCCDINNNPLLRQCIHRHLIFISDLNNVEAINKRLEIMQSELENKPFLNLNQFDTSVLKTTLYPNQVHNVNFMLQREDNLPVVQISQERLLHFPDGRIYDYQNKKMVQQDEIPVTTIKGGINFDNIGQGKTLQMLMLCHLKPMPTLIAVPDHLKQQWAQEIDKHFTVPLHIDIKTFKELNEKIITTSYDRLIVDELHELFDNRFNNLYKKLCELPTKFKWGVSGTAFSSITVNPLFKMLNFLSEIKYTNSFVVKYIYYQSILKGFFVRTPLKEYINLPECNIENCLLEFTELERTIYEAELISAKIKNTDTLRRICCDVIIHFKKNKDKKITKKQFKDDVLSHYLNNLNETANKLVACQERIKNIDEEFSKNPGKRELLENKNHYERELSSLKDEYNLRNISYNFLKENFESKKDDCSICVTEINSEYTLLSCGHYFHNNCINNWFAVSGKKICPYCRKELSDDNIYAIIDNNIPEQIYSTKLIQLLKKVKENDKTIVFTQYPDLIDKMLDVFEKNEISSLVLDDYEKINQFKNTNVKALILSSLSNASGLNLQFCQNIIIFEPIKGDYVFLREIEKQVIGRIMRLGQNKNCNVTRFIVKDTIEEELYRKYF